MKRFWLAFLFILVLLPSQAFDITGRVLSATDESVLEMATIRLFSYNGSDSILVLGAQTGLDGSFLLRNIADGEYKLFVSNVGFVEQNKSVRVAGRDVAIGTLRLNEDIKALAEIQVQGHAAEMIVKGDTIEYNTAAYNVGENAMVEDLLKKMNGVTVDAEGNVTVNGENITAIRIDGKKFFGNDVQSATKNIPADMIEKVQVIDEKSDMAKLTGFDDDEGEHIINLTLKKDRKRGIFGNYKGGLGADMVTANGGWFDYGNPAYGATALDRTRHFFGDDFRYTLNLFTNILLGESQTTIIGGANNTNEVKMGRGRNAGFGQSANSGITWSENLGINTNVDFTGKITPVDSKTTLLFGGDGSLNHSYNDTRSEQQKTEYAGETTYKSSQLSDKDSRGWDVNLRFELDYQIDSLNKILIQPSLSYTGSSSLSHSEYNYWEDSTLINIGEQDKIDTSRQISAGTKITYNRKFLRPGRSLTLTGNYNFSTTDGFNMTIATGTNKVDQYTFSGNRNHGYSLRMSYVEPIYHNNHLLEIAADFSGRNRTSHKDQFSKDTLIGEYAFDSTYSNLLANNYYVEQLELNYRWVSEKTDLTVGLKGLATQTHSATSYGGVQLRDTIVYAFNFAPSVNFKYKFGKKEFARFTYRGTATQPSINQMEPVRNNSNAMNETVGNLALNPSFAHNLRFMYSRFNQDLFSSIMAGLQGTLTQHALVNNSIYDETGKLYQQTVNADALPWNINANLMYNIPFAQKMFQFNTRTTISFNQRVAYIQRGQTAAEIAQMIETNTFIRGERSLTNNLRASEDLNLRFTHSIVDIGIRANFTYSRTNNNLTHNSTSNVYNWGITGDIEFHLPKQWTISADCGYTARYGYQLNDVDEIILNASIDKTWDIATLSLNVYDILHQRKNIVQVINDNSVSCAKYNTLPTYFMLTCTFKLNKMGDLKAKGAAGRMQEMMENGGSPMNPNRGGVPMPPPNQL